MEWMKLIKIKVNLSAVMPKITFECETPTKVIQIVGKTLSDQIFSMLANDQRRCEIYFEKLFELRYFSH